ncbi:uncharacterized protein LDX57_013069 [Aspergillus melleus]|uniref:uncharacterized protein n=1 Tax=Aspergillus melleus TaxID=138277 RepID=UPI001E8D8CD3|nr:uncharacterized protein LDX57_013069 [Aspergillus melleus]KAH8430991.1 hypothetical protein LDX57_013069 [Aspergillus melleus]
MPKSSKDLVHQEGRIALALQAIKNGQITSVRGAARIFDVSRSTLQHRLNGRHSRQEIRPNSHKLTEREEESLEKWILSLDSRGAPPRNSMVREMANMLLRKRGDQDLHISVGEKWVSNFVARHETLKSRYSRQLDIKRAKCENPRTIQAWFDRVQLAIREYGILDEDIFNFDETGFCMGQVATAKVITRSTCEGKPFLVQPGNREWVTSIECINAAGWALPPYLILKGAVHIEGWYESQLPSTWRINLSPNGWTSNEISLHWLENHFVPWITNRRVGKYSLLILDGHESHLTPKFDDICYQNNIIPVCMPAGSSHLCQPLDVACFAPLKQAYYGLVERLIRARYQHIDKNDFLDEYPKAHLMAFKSINIKSAFRASGLVPFKPSEVLDQLIYEEPSRPSSGDSQSTISKTPMNAKQFKKQELRFQQLLSNDMINTPMKSALGYIFKGAEMALNRAVLIEQEVQELRWANEKRDTKKRRSKKQIAGLNGFTVEEAREVFQRDRARDEAIGIIPGQEDQPRRRAPPRCSECHNLGHIRTRCPNRVTA